MPKNGKRRWTTKSISFKNLGRGWLKTYHLVKQQYHAKVKRGPNGEVQSYRVRIVAGGHRQVEGINYTETFYAAAKMPTVCVVLANAAHQDWEIEHVDVKSAYLNAPLRETIYMKPPRGVLKPGEEGKVLRLLKGLYGLKQAGRGWYLEMTRVFLKELDFKRSAIDHSMYFRHKGE